MKRLENRKAAIKRRLPFNNDATPSGFGSVNVDVVPLLICWIGRALRTMSLFLSSPSEGRQRMRNGGEIPTAGRDRTYLTINPDIENCRSPRGNCSFQLRRQIAGFFDEQAGGTHGTRHHCVISGEQFAASVFKTGSKFSVLAEVSHLLIAYGAVAKVVPDKPDHWDVILNGREHSTRIHGEATIATNRDHRAVGSGQLCAQRTSDSESHRSKTPTLQEGLARRSVPFHHQPVVMYAHIREHDAIFRHNLSQFCDRALGADRHGI